MTKEVHQKETCNTRTESTATEDTNLNFKNCAKKDILQNYKNTTSFCEVIPIPGTSQMPPPFYKTIYSMDPNVMRIEKQRILNKPHLLFAPVIYLSSDDESENEENETKVEEKFKNITSYGLNNRKKTSHTTTTKSTSTIPDMIDISNTYVHSEPQHSRELAKGINKNKIGECHSNSLKVN